MTENPGAAENRSIVNRQRCIGGLGIVLSTAMLAGALIGATAAGQTTNSSAPFIACGKVSGLEIASETLRVKPSSCLIGALGAPLSERASLTRLKWKHWGAASAKFKGIGLYAFNGLHRFKVHGRAYGLAADVCNGQSMLRYTKVTVKSKHAQVFDQPTCAEIQYSSFLSPDRAVWCRMAADEGFCATNTGSGQASATLHHDGSLTLCSASVCFQNWDDSATVLASGQQVDVYGYSCSSVPQGITCVVSQPGAGSGRGFTIGPGGVTPVAP